MASKVAAKECRCEKVWRPDELLYWLCSMRQIEPDRLAGLLTPEQVDKAVAAVRHWMDRCDLARKEL
jgi:hypothetical protein